MIVLYILIGLVVILVVLFGMMIRGYSNSPRPHRSTPKNFDIPFAEVRFPTRNNCKLYGWWVHVKVESNTVYPAIVLVHGWNRNLERLLPYIDNLYSRRYNLLAFDSRNHGSSDEDGYSSMLKFAEDIFSAIDFLQGQPGVDKDKIGVIGLSIGGAAAIYASAKDSRIKKAIAVGAFANPYDLMFAEFEKRKVPSILTKMFLKYVQFRIKTSFTEIAPANNIKNSKADILIVHGTNDEIVPYEEAGKLLNAAGKAKVQLLTLPGSAHSNCHEHPAFWEEVENFLEKWN